MLLNLKTKEVDFPMFEQILTALGLSGANVLVSAILVCIVCVIVIQIIMKAVDKLLARSQKLDGMLKGFIKTALRIALWVIAIILVAGALGIPTASLVAVLSIAGLALSLSVQNILANLFSGITLLITKPFAAGDLVDVAGNNGTVKTVGLFYTVLDTLDNKVVSIPNSDVTGASITNYSRNPLRRVDLTFSVSYETSTEEVRAAVREAAKAVPQVLADPEPFIVIGAYKESRIEYIVRVWCNSADYWDVYFGMNEQVRESFNARGVKLTYDHINVHMVSD